MSYMGNSPPNIGAYGVESFNGGGTSFTLSKAATTATVLLFIDGVRQTPGDAYSVSGTTLTTTATTPSGTDNVTVQFLGDVVDFGEPSDDSVGVAKLSATGTASSSTYLRGDNSWATISEYDDSNIQTDIALLGFKVAANGSLAAYNLDDQTVDAFEDASGIDASTSTNETRNASDYYSGHSTTAGATTAFTTVETTSWTAPSGVTSVNYLVVAGGGSGGGGQHANYGGGGGGAGGLLTGTHSVTPGTSYTVTVGAGGSNTNTNEVGADGSNSVFDSFTATGGGGGGHAATNGRDGGSGGGGGGTSSGGSGTSGQGNGGGGSEQYNAGGGGGKGGSGSSATTTSGGDGGAGYDATTVFGTSYGVSGFFAGGGGGGWNSYFGTDTPGSGGSGGGGAGGTNNTSNGNNATANTGGGGGGGSSGTSSSTHGGDGGSGIVLVKYDEINNYNDMTLVSNATTADSAPTNGDLVMTYTNGSGTATVNTDLKAYVSRDNGTTWTQATLSSDGTTGGHTILTAHNIDISSQPSGTSMRYKIETLNQSASKETRIQAVSLGWS